MIAPKATGNCSTGPFIAFVVGRLQRRVRAGELDRRGLQVGDAGAGADRVEVDRQALGLEGRAPLLVDRRGERRAGAVERRRAAAAARAAGARAAGDGAGSPELELLELTGAPAAGGDPERCGQRHRDRAETTVYALCFSLFMFESGRVSTAARPHGVIEL